MKKIIIAKKKYEIKRVVIGGGVSANSEIRKVLEEKAILENWEIFLPPLEYTTDIAAMIGIVGYYKLLNQKLGTINQSVSARLSL